MTPRGIALRTVVAVLVGCYPRSFRERWGAALTNDSVAAGWRSCPNLATGAVDMWLHPAVWPADDRDQRHRRAAVLAVAVAESAWLVAHAVTEIDGSLAVRMQHTGAVTVCLALLALGLALLTPLPVLSRSCVRGWVSALVRGLGPGAALGAAVVVVVNAGPTWLDRPGWRVTLLVLWWCALALAAVGACRALAALGSFVRPVHPVRIRSGLGCLIASTALTAGTIVHAGRGVSAWTVGVGLGTAALVTLSVLTVATLRDLAALPSPN